VKILTGHDAPRDAGLGVAKTEYAGINYTRWRTGPIVALYGYGRYATRFVGYRQLNEANQFMKKTDKNIIWIVLDSIRADRTPFGGHSRQTMPVLEEFASRPDSLGTTCTSHGIWSLPSMASMMTGVWPSHHGAGLHNEVLPAEFTTVAERLSERSYRTVGVSRNSYFSSTTGLDRGFDEFHQVSVGDLFVQAGLSGTAAFLRNVRKYSGGMTIEKRKHSPDFLLNEIIKNRLQELANGDEPFALFGHYLGSHHPYYPSPFFRDEFDVPGSLSASEAAELAFQTTSDVYSTIANSDSITDPEWEAIRTMYDALIRQTDSLIERLIHAIEALGLLDETILVITSDHGDLLGEADLVSHKLLLYDALTQVPVVVHGSDRMKGIDSDNLQHIDILQTILEEVGASTEGMHGSTFPDFGREYAVTQRGKQTADRTIKRVTEYEPEFSNDAVQRGLLTAIRKDEWKLVRGDSGSKLYRLPDEGVDESSNYPEKSRSLNEIHDDWMERYGKRVLTREQAEFSESAKRRLAELGYVTD